MPSVSGEQAFTLRNPDAEFSFVANVFSVI